MKKVKVLALGGLTAVATTVLTAGLIEYARRVKKDSNNFVEDIMNKEVVNEEVVDVEVKEEETEAE